MPRVKTLAVCIRKIDYSETSQVLWLLTPRYGRVTVMAKGSKRGTKKRPPAPLETACLYDLVYYEKADADMATLAEYQLIEHFSGLHAALPRFFAAMYALEICRKAVMAHAEAEEFFQAFVHTLQALNVTTDPRLPIEYLKIETLRFLGSLPEIDECVSCGARLRREKRPPQITLSITGGGVVCQLCRDSHPRIYKVPRTALSAYESLAHWGLPPDGAGDAELLSVRGLVDPFFRYHFDHPMKLAAFCR